MKVWNLWTGEDNLIFKRKKDALQQLQELIDDCCNDFEECEMSVTPIEMTKEEFENLPDYS